MMIGIAGFTRGDNFGDSLMFAIYANYLKNNGYECCIVGGENWFLERIHQLGVDVKVISDKKMKGAVDKCIFIGGGYFGWPDLIAPLWQLRYIKNNPYKSISDECVKAGIPYALEGVEVGPGLFPLAEKVIRPILSNAKSIVVRNPESMKYVNMLSSRNASIRYDVILGNLNHANVDIGSLVKDSEGGFVLGLHLTGSVIGDNFFAKKYRSMLINAILSTHVDKIILFSDNVLTTVKLLKTKQLQADLSKNNVIVEIHDYNGIEKAIKSIAQMDMLITTKLHCGVVGLALDKYVVCMGSSPKLRRFYNFVNLSEHYMHYFFSTSGMKARFVANHIDHARQGFGSLISDEIKQDSRKYMTSLPELLDNM